MRDILLFMVEYPKWKASSKKPNEVAFADEVEL